MFLALSRGVPEAGVTFALAMMVGVGLTLAAVATLTILVRERLVDFLARYGQSLNRVGRVIDGAAGAILLMIGLRELVL